MTRKLVLGTTLLLLGALAAVPTAAAEPQLACPTLPLWDATWCWVGVGLRVVNEQYDFVTCDVIGGPVCGLVICDEVKICNITAA